MKVKSESEVAQLCPTLSDPMDRSPPGSSVHGIFQARVLEWGAIAFSETPHSHKLKKIFFKFNPGHLLIPLDTVGHWTLSGAFCQPPVFKAPFDYWGQCL